jgi:hypothetical protein
MLVADVLYCNHGQADLLPIEPRAIARELSGRRSPLFTGGREPASTEAPLFLCLLAPGLAASHAASPSEGAVAIAAIRSLMAPANPFDDRPDDASRPFTAVPRAIPAPSRNASVVSSSSLESRSSG